MVAIVKQIVTQIPPQMRQQTAVCVYVYVCVCLSLFAFLPLWKVNQPAKVKAWAK